MTVLPDPLEQWGAFCHWPNPEASRRAKADRTRNARAARERNLTAHLVGWQPGMGKCPVALRKQFNLCRRCAERPRKHGRERCVECTASARDRARDMVQAKRYAERKSA